MTARKKNYLAALAILMVVAVVWLLTIRRTPSGPNESIKDLTGQPARDVANSLTDAPSARGNVIQASTGLSASSERQSHTERARLHQIEMAFTEKNVPIHFWGRVVDQDEMPLSGVRVVMSARTWQTVPATGTTSPKMETLTDSDGRFEIQGLNGDLLSRDALEKTGYRLSPKAPISFSYGQSSEPFTPNSQEPVVFRMWKIVPAEELLSRRKFWGVVPDGRTYTFDLLADTKQEGENNVGDLRVRIVRPAVVKPRDRFAWKLELVGVNGGLVEVQDEFLFRAPESGYTRALNFDMDPAKEDWTSVMKKEFYLSSRSGTVYSVLRLELIPDYNDKSAIQIEAVINAKGSRNLQP